MTAPAITEYLNVVPARITPLPPGVPTGVPLRAVVTELALTVLWQAAGEIGRADYPMTAEQTAGVDTIPWQVGPYTITAAGGCGCGMSRLQRFQPFEGFVVSNPRRAASGPQTPYGLIPPRYSRA